MRRELGVAPTALPSAFELGSTHEDGMFSSTLTLWREFESRASAPFDSNTATEVRERLQQLSFFADHVMRTDRLAADAEKRMVQQMRCGVGGLDTSTFELMREPLFELRAYAEAFYYFAFRIRAVVRKFPEFKNFECPGVRNVRNLLVEHPERPDSRALVWSFGYDDRKGAMLKSVQPVAGTNPFKDPGFVANAQEFREELEAALVRTLGKP